VSFSSARNSFRLRFFWPRIKTRAWQQIKITVYEKVIPLDLRAIRYAVPQNKEKDGVMIPLSPEETYLLSQL
jgi:hypothetical protein